MIELRECGVRALDAKTARATTGGGICLFHDFGAFGAFGGPARAPRQPFAPVAPVTAAPIPGLSTPVDLARWHGAE